MPEEKSQGAGTVTEEAPGENTVQITFLPEGKTVQFEHGKLPYEDHGKEESILDIALNYGIPLDHACGTPRHSLNCLGNEISLSPRSALSKGMS